MAKMPKIIYVKNMQSGDEKWRACAEEAAVLVDSVGDDVFVGVYELIATQRVKGVIVVSNELKAKRK